MSAGGVRPNGLRDWAPEVKLAVKELGWKNRAMESTQFSVFRKIEDSPQVALHGQVFTKPHVASLMLDLAGYTPDRPLEKMRLLEPGCGDGSFLIEAAKKL